jgi:integrase
VFTVARKEWHWLSHNPMDGVSKPRESSGRVRYLSDDERQKLLAETVKHPTLHTVVILTLSTAARAGELMKLTWNDVDLKEGRLLFRDTKNAEPRTAWAQGEALRLLKEHATVRRIDTALVFAAPGGGRYDYHASFGTAVNAAGITDFKFHDLRHSAATYLAIEGATESQLRAIGGWKSGVVRKYVHIASTDAKDVLAKINKKILGGKDEVPSVGTHTMGGGSRHLLRVEPDHCLVRLFFPRSPRSRIFASLWIALAASHIARYIRTHPTAL